MAVRELSAPARSRTRKARYPFSTAEVSGAIKSLKAGKTPGVGPYEGENAVREARSAAQSLIRHILQVEPDMNLGTRSWTDDNGDAFAVVTQRA